MVAKVSQYQRQESETGRLLPRRSSFVKTSEGGKDPPSDQLQPEWKRPVLPGITDHFYPSSITGRSKLATSLRNYTFTS